KVCLFIAAVPFSISRLFASSMSNVECSTMSNVEWICQTTNSPNGLGRGVIWSNSFDMGHSATLKTAEPKFLLAFSAKTTRSPQFILHLYECSRTVMSNSVGVRPANWRVFLTELGEADRPVSG